MRVPKTINPLGWTIVCLSDTHSKLNNIRSIPQGDILLHAGDFSNVGELPDIQRFHEHFRSMPHPIKIFIAGNHDLSIDEDVFCNPLRAHEFNRYANRLNMTTKQYHDKVMEVVRSEECSTGFLKYLSDESVTVSSDIEDQPPLKVYGSPWQPEFFDWAFNLPRGPALAEKWAHIPADTDILITHGPPYGIQDQTSRHEPVGCEELRKLFDQGTIHPRIHLFGHIHEAYGMTIPLLSKELFIASTAISL